MTLDPAQVLAEFTVTMREWAAASSDPVTRAGWLPWGAAPSHQDAARVLSRSRYILGRNPQ